MPLKQSYVGADGELQEITVSEFAYPYFMFDKRTGRPAFTYSRGMLVLEEYGQATGDVKRATAPIIRELRRSVAPLHEDRVLADDIAEARRFVDRELPRWAEELA